MSQKELPPLYIVSGGAGASGKLVVDTVLVQFPDCHAPVITAAHVRSPEQVEQVVAQAQANGGAIVHTMVDTRLGGQLSRLAQERGVKTIDLMGPLIEHLAEQLEQAPQQQPGLYRKLHRDYFERVGAIEFSIDHDDGKKPEDWPQADMVLVGISRVGKTPLSMYLAVQGWKVANMPLVRGLSLPETLFQLDPGRVIGLTVEPGQLVIHREKRQRTLGAPGPSAYSDPLKIYEEVEAAEKFYKKRGFAIINITDKPIEATADEIIRLINRRQPMLRKG